MRRLFSRESEKRYLIELLALTLMVTAFWVSPAAARGPQGTRGRDGLEKPGRHRTDDSDGLDQEQLCNPGLPGGLRSEPVFHHRGGAAHSPHRPDLSLFGPEGKV